jgi:hypothetical protein
VWISALSEECFSVSEPELDGECLVPETQEIGKCFVKVHLSV